MSAAKPKATAHRLADAAHRGLKLRVRRARALWVRLNAALEARKDRGFIVNGVAVPADHVSWLAVDVDERLRVVTQIFDGKGADRYRLGLEDAAATAIAGAIYAKVIHAAMECCPGHSWTDADFAEAEIARKLYEQLTALVTAIDAANPEGN